jgi:hypothetical protein
LPCKHLIALR